MEWTIIVSIRPLRRIRHLVTSEFDGNVYKYPFSGISKC